MRACAKRRAAAVPEKLPPFIVSRDRLAHAAGLCVERAYDGEYLITRYVGTYETLLASPFIVDKANIRIPSSCRHCTKVGVWRYPTPYPEARSLVGAFRRDDSLFYVKYEDSFPNAFGSLDGGTEYVRYERMLWKTEVVVYIGTRESLLDDGVATESQLPPIESSNADRRRREFAVIRGHHQPLWESDLMADGRVRHIKYTSTQQAAKEEEEARKRGAQVYRADYEFRQDIQSYLDVLIRAVLRLATKPQGGSTRYFFDAATIGKLEALAREMGEIAACAPVRSIQQAKSEHQPNERVRSAAINAATDRAFQQFLRSSIPGRSEG